LNVVEKLLAHGADADLATSDGRTPLYVASKGGHADAVEMLLDKGADVDKASSAGRSPLQLAADNGHAAAVRVLLRAEANIWDESQGFTNVAGRLSRAAVVEMKRSIDALR